MLILFVLGWGMMSNNCIGLHVAYSHTTHTPVTEDVQLLFTNTSVFCGVREGNALYIRADGEDNNHSGICS